MKTPQMSMFFILKRQAMNLSILKLVYDVFGASVDNSALTSDAASAPKPKNSIISPDLIALKAP